MSRRLVFFLLTFYFATVNETHAASPCYFLSVPCKGSSDTVSGGAYPSFADMFNINPASIPTIPTPVGIESIVSSTSEVSTKMNYNFAFIKGFQRVGTAVSSNSDNTFYSYNLAQGYIGNPYKSAFDKKVAAYSVLPTINVGSAMALLDEKLKPIMSPNLGIVARYNKISKAWDYGVGASANSEYVTVGVSSIRTKGEKSLGFPETTTSTASFGLKIMKFNFEYTVLYYRTEDPTVMSLPIFTDPVKIVTASLQLKSFIGTAAYRTAKNIMGDQAYLWLLSLQYQFTNHFALSYLSNYIPGTKSVGLQIFF